MFGLSLDLFRQHVMAHSERLRSICDHSTNFCSLRICGWMCHIYVIGNYCKAVQICNVGACGGGYVKWHPMSSFSIHLKSGSKIVMNR